MPKKKNKTTAEESCDVSADEVLRNILNEPEWDKFECKRAAAQPGDLLKTVVAMANTSGGTFVIGLEDPKKAEGKDRLIGISENRDNVSEFLKQLKQDIDPLVTVEELEFEITNINNYQDALLVLQIEKGKDVHSLRKGDTYVRKGSQNRKIAAKEIRHLQNERGENKFEDRISAVATLDDVDVVLLEQYKKDVGSASKDMWHLLKGNGLAVAKEGAFYLTEAGILLFGNNPAVTLKSKCEIKMSRYRGTRRVYSGAPNLVGRPVTIGGNLPNQIKEAVGYFSKMVKESPPVLQGSSFRPSLSIPEWVFQEAVVNAVIHRNYFLQDDIQIRFFDNCIEVESPGTYPGNITPSNILEDRFSRNVIIQRILSRFSKPPNLDLGEGVNRMFAIMKKNNLYDPLYTPSSIRPNTVLLVLYTVPRDVYWDSISVHLDECYSISNAEARDITGETSSVTMSRTLKKWVDMGLLEKMGRSKRGMHYRKVGQEMPKELFDMAK